MSENDQKVNSDKLLAPLRALRERLVFIAPDSRGATANIDASDLLCRIVDCANNVLRALHAVLPFEQWTKVIEARDPGFAGWLEKHASETLREMNKPEQKQIAGLQALLGQVFRFERLRNPALAPFGTYARDFPYAISGNRAADFRASYLVLNESFDAIVVSFGCESLSTAKLFDPSGFSVQTIASVTPQLIINYERAVACFEQLVDLYRLTLLIGKYTRSLKAVLPDGDGSGDSATAGSPGTIATAAAAVKILADKLHFTEELQALAQVSKPLDCIVFGRVLTELLSLANGIGAWDRARDVTTSLPPEKLRELVSELAIAPLIRMGFYAEKLGLIDDAHRAPIELLDRKVVGYLVAVHRYSDNAARHLDCDTIADILRKDFEAPNAQHHESSRSIPDTQDPSATPSSTSMRKPSRKPRNRPTKPTSQVVASWVFGSILLAFVLVVFFLAPERLVLWKQELLAFICALLAGLFGYFLAGTLNVTSEGRLPFFGKMAVRAGSGVALFLIVLCWWGSTAAPVKPLESDRKVLPSSSGTPSSGPSADR